MYPNYQRFLYYYYLTPSLKYYSVEYLPFNLGGVGPSDASKQILVLVLVPTPGIWVRTRNQENGLLINQEAGPQIMTCLQLPDWLVGVSWPVTHLLHLSRNRGPCYELLSGFPIGKEAIPLATGTAGQRAFFPSSQQHSDWKHTFLWPALE